MKIINFKNIVLILSCLLFHIHIIRDIKIIKKKRLMQEKLSIKKNIIKYNLETLNHDIESILLERFEDPAELEMTIDDLHDPFALKDMDKAVARLLEAKENDEKVMIFGDYDVDGVTSTSILMHFFKKIGLKASYRLPHRVND
jgi:hypothetical protein